MATSGSIDFTVTRDDIITEALLQVGVLAEGDSPTSDQLTANSRLLNMMVKSWQAEGLNLFAVETLYVFLEKNKTQYSLGPSGDKFTSSFVHTEVSTAASSTDTTIDVDSISGISSGDNIGVELDGGTLQWTTVNGAPSGSTITLTDALTDDVSVDATVYTYTTAGNRPMSIHNSVIRNKDEVDTSVDIIARTEWAELSQKTTDGSISQIYFDPQVGTAYVNVYPQSDSETDILVLWVQRTLEDFDAASDDADFPQEWYLALTFGLAGLMCPKYGVPAMVAQEILQMGEFQKEVAQGFDREYSVMFGVETRG